MCIAVVAVLIGSLAMATFWWQPTFAILAGILAVGVGVLGRRRLVRGGQTGMTPIRAKRMNCLGSALGAVAAVGSIIVVVVTTDW